MVRSAIVSRCGVVLSVDPWADACKGADEVTKQDQPVHIRIQQRNGRKTLTTVQGIVDDYDKKKLVKVFKKVCNNFTALSAITVLCLLHFQLMKLCFTESRRFNVLPVY